MQEMSDLSCFWCHGLLCGRAAQIVPLTVLLILLQPVLLPDCRANASQDQTALVHFLGMVILRRACSAKSCANSITAHFRLATSHAHTLVLSA